MTEKRRVRARVLPTALVVVLAIGGALVACADTTKVLGEECIKSQDCQSGLCESQVCVAAPPFLMIPTAGDGGADTSAPDTSSPDSASPDGDDGGDADPG